MKCTKCGEEFANLTIIDDVDRVCPSCLDCFYQYCPRCGEYYDPDYVDFPEVDGELICEYCFEDDEE